MSQHFSLVCIVAGCLLSNAVRSLAGELAQSSRSTSDPLDAFPATTHLIQGWVDKGYYPGAALLVMKDGSVIYERYFGDHKPETVDYIASSGKWLAAATIAAVVDDGKLSLDDPASKWLPEFKDAKGHATLRQMLSHTSGYPPYQPKGNPPDAYQTLTEAVAHIAPLPPVADPGEKFDYGGLAMQVAGRMAEIASGKDWETLFQEKIARPLQMQNTHFTPVDPTGGHNPMLGGGARGTAQDYANFLRMIAANGLFDGRRVLSERMIAEMEADQVGHAHVNIENEYVFKARGERHTGIYGLGEWRQRLDARGQAIQISSPSWAGALPWIDKARNVQGIFLAHVNVENAGKDKFNAFFASPEIVTGVDETLDQLGKIAQ